MLRLKEEILAIGGTFAAVAVVSLVVLSLLMPFVFPVVVVIGLLAWYHADHVKRITRTRPGGAIKLAV